MSWENRLITALIQDSPIFFIAIRAKGEIITMNETMLRKLGYTKEEIEGKNYLSTLVPKAERRALTRVAHLLLGTRGPIVHENRLLTKNGQELVVVWHGRATSTITGELDCLVNIGVDITDRRRAEERLEHLNKVLHTVLQINQLVTEGKDPDRLLQGT